MDAERRIRQGFDYARDAFAALGVDAEAAAERADAVPVSMHCWQGDDVGGFDGAETLTGGIAVTGNYPGRARTPEELMADIRAALSLAPGRKKLNLHACYAIRGGKRVDRDAYTAEEFAPWLAFARDEGLGLDFNPTYFSHPMMDGSLSLSSPDPAKRRFWVEHGKRCREIAQSFAGALGQPCVVNFWMPDGSKDTRADTRGIRERMTASLDEIFADKAGLDQAPCALESKLFGVGVESFTVVSAEYALGYALTRGIHPCLDTGHYHPTEAVSAKISAVLAFHEKMLLHVSRPVRWDSDHVVALDDELQRIMDEVVWNGFLDRVFIGLDYFDASVNRVAAWAVGMRNARKALLGALLAPAKAFREAEEAGDLTARLALMEERKTLPLGAVWDWYCLTRGIPADGQWLDAVRRYERETLAGRG
ncbi:MAG TPA: L-rhamnose isomerase [Candidatus Limnocylindria bacterium]|nr:L-rhamnose isomerase [Candidatus Limnocylindria bacterium]